MAPDDPPDPPPGSSPAADGVADAAADDATDDVAEADADAPADEPTSELRAKDLIGRSRQELEAELDPATLAELASWFIRPSMVEVLAREVPAEVTAGAGVRQLDDFERLGVALGDLEADRTEQRLKAAASVEPRMVALLERHERAVDLIVPVRTFESVIDETLFPASVLALVPNEDTPLAVDEPRLVEIPPDILQLLESDNAPQAVLRDLNRPVEDFERRMEPVFPPPPPEQDMTFAIRDALRWRPEKMPPPVRVPDVRAEWRAVNRQPWAEQVAVARAARAAQIAEADAQAEADAANGIVWRF